jgi:hypothetical protein
MHSHCYMNERLLNNSEECFQHGSPRKPKVAPMVSTLYKDGIISVHRFEYPTNSRDEHFIEVEHQDVVISQKSPLLGFMKSVKLAAEWLATSREHGLEGCLSVCRGPWHSFDSSSHRIVRSGSRCWKRVPIHTKEPPTFNNVFLLSGIYHVDRWATRQGRKPRQSSINLSSRSKTDDDNNSTTGSLLVVSIRRRYKRCQPFCETRSGRNRAATNLGKRDTRRLFDALSKLSGLFFVDSPKVLVERCLCSVTTMTTSPWFAPPKSW